MRSLHIIYYKVFDADYTTHSATNQQSDKTITDNPSIGVAYSLAVGDPWVTALGTVDGSGNWTAKNDQVWFTLAKNADGTKYIVTATANMTTADNAKSAATWLLANKPASGITTSTLTGIDATKSNGYFTEWSATVPAGYYLIQSSAGENLVAATTNVDIVEKNTYPTIDKKQKDADTNDYKDEDVNVKVGDIIDYEVIVTVPADANQAIIVTDTMSAGLKYLTDPGLAYTSSKSGVTVSAGTVATTADEYDANATWQISLDGATYKGQTITITFKAQVTAAALVDTGKENEVKLQYDNTKYQMTDEVKYVIDATGAIKYDGDKAEVVNDIVQLKSDQSGTYLLADAEFKLQGKTVAGAWEDISVIKVGTYYRPLDPQAATAETAAAAIVSDSNGEIIIRGLDHDRDYQLVETKAPTGFNLATAPAALTKTTDSKANVTISGEANETTTKLTAANIQKVQNNKGSVLPSTGGIGTTIFYVIGAILVLGAGILLVTRRRVSAN